MKNVAVHTKSGRSIGVFNVPAWQFITYSKKSKRLGRQSIVKEAAATTTTEENASIFEELVCSQEDEPGTHNSIR